MSEFYTDDEHTITISDADEEGVRWVTCDCGGFSEQTHWSDQATNKAMDHVLEHDMMTESEE